MRLLYFASVREGIGRPSEELAVPAAVGTVGDLLDWLRNRGPEYEHTLAEGTAIRVALDRVHARPEAGIAGVSEAALFPPMTGG